MQLLWILYFTIFQSNCLFTLGDYIQIEKNKSYSIKKGDVQIFCKPSYHKSITKIWSQSMIISLNPNISFSLIEANDPETVLFKYTNTSTFWSIFNQVFQTNVRYLPYFDQVCFIIMSSHSLKFKYQIYDYDKLSIFLMFIGMIIFYASFRFSRSVVLFYTFSISFGVVCSLLILAYIISRYIPRKLTSFFLIFGFPPFLMLLQFFWDRLIFARKYILYYIIASSLISFAFAYLKGPPTNIRSLVLIQRIIQVIGLILIFFAVHSPYSLILITCIIAHYCFSEKIYIMFRYFKIFSKKDPKIRFLSEQEFDEQSIVFTASELNKLREFCKSLDANAWKIVSKLKDPRRFAQFVEGMNHVENEIQEYDGFLVNEIEEPSDQGSKIESSPSKEDNSISCEET